MWQQLLFQLMEIETKGVWAWFQRMCGILRSAGVDVMGDLGLDFDFDDGMGSDEGDEEYDEDGW